MKKLNPRQWALYHLLKDFSDEYLTQKQICDYLPQHYPLMGKEEFNNSSSRRLLTDDIAIINDDITIQKIIISNGSGVKIANKDEYLRYSNCQWARITRMINKIKTKDDKARLDNQMRLVFNSGSKARNFFEVFADE